MNLNDFRRGLTNASRITILVLSNIIMLIFNVVFTTIKFLFLILIVMLSLGKLGMNTMDFGGRRK